MPDPGNSHLQTEIRLPAANQPAHEAHETTPEPGEIEHGLSGVEPEHALEAGDTGTHRGRGTELEHASGSLATGKGEGGGGSGGHR
jgi:hypothetical protein